MGRRQILLVDSIFGGEAHNQYFTGAGQYNKGIGIDPFLPISDSVGDRKSSGVIRPSPSEAFSGANINSNPYWLVTNPKDTKLYAILNNGRLVSYSSSLGSETLVGTATSSSGNGAVYYNNYIYIGTNTDISRYGPLDGTPSLTNSVWTGATLGSQTALVNTTYPSIRGGGTMPNHVMHVHGNNQLYVADFDSTSSTDTTRGKGLIHAIKTKFGTDEGDTNDGSAYNVLDLPLGFMPTCMASFGTDLVIGAIQASDSTISQGRAKLFFWDTFASSFYNEVELPDTLVTAMKNVNGNLYIFSGNISTGSDVSNGYRISVYVGGQSVQTLHYSNTGAPPLHGAVESVGDRVLWGTFEQVQTTTPGSPTYYSVVKSFGTEDPAIPGGVHTVINTTGTGAAGDGVVTALKKVEEASFSFPKMVIGHRDAGGSALDKQGTSYGTCVFDSQLFNVGRQFIIRRVRVNLADAVGANMTITPAVFKDNASSSSTQGLRVINNTNYGNSERIIQWRPDINCKQNFFLRLTFSGTALLPVLLPIEIEIEEIED